MASAGRSSGRPPGPQTGLAKQAKHTKHTKQHSPGPQLVPPAALAACPQRQAPLCNLLGPPTKLFVSSSAALRALFLVFRRCPDPATAFPCRSPEWIIDANPLKVMLPLFPFASRVETDPGEARRAACRSDNASAGCCLSLRPIDWGKPQVRNLPTTIIIFTEYWENGPHWHHHL